ncbi:MAG: HDIG domain-containing protein [Armatimonadetes bacterium]|nr:HDIG domain-containing protein [Armatimonadota bacterium]
MARKNSNGRKEQGPAKLFGVEITPGLIRRALLTVTVVAALSFALWGRLLPQRARLELGKPAPKTIFAPRSAYYNDTAKTEALRRQARALVPDQYQANPQARDLALRTVRDIFSLVRKARESQQLPDLASKLEWIHTQLDVKLSDRTLLLMLQAQKGALDRMEDAAAKIVRNLMLLKIRDNTDDLEQARGKAQDEAAKLPMERSYQQAVGEIAGKALRPNQIFDPVETQRLRDLRASEVQPVRGSIQANEVVVYAGETVTQRHLDIARALGLMQPRVDYLRALAIIASLCILVLAFGYFVYRFSPKYYHEDKYLLVAAGLTVAASVVYRVTLGTASFEAASLGAGIGCVIALCLLADSLVAIGLGTMLAVLLGMVAAGSDARLVIVALFVNLLVVFSMGRGYQRTSMIARTALLAAMANAFLLLLGDLVFGVMVSWRLLGQTAAAGLLGATAGTGLVLILQRPLQITTDMWLLELGNPNEPILRKLLTEAPGSYQASLMVANLAEAAAEAIGAHALLARVAATYHDIGKTKRPGFFIENQFGGENPHDKLTPQLSAMVLAAHVTDGVEMARQLRMPPEIISAIQQHHGTSLMTFFYEKAKTLAKPGEEVPEARFRYPGPKPQTKENAIIMLADCVEAAARTLDSYDPETIRQMVEKIVQGRVDDGQLDEAPLTLAELTAVKEQLIQTLITIYHRRIPYPDQIEQEMKNRDQRRQPLEHRSRKQDKGPEQTDASGNH